MEKIPKYLKTPGLHNKVDLMRHLQGLKRNKHRALKENTEWSCPRQIDQKMLCEKLKLEDRKRQAKNGKESSITCFFFFQLMYNNFIHVNSQIFIPSFNQ